MRIGFVTQWFPPEPGTVVASAIAEGLASRGHEVHVLTGFPNYPTGVVQAGYPVRPYRRDHHGDVTVHRAPLYPSHDRSAVRRVANYASYAAAATVVGSTRLPRPDAWLVYSSPATAAVPALLARWGDKVPTYLVIEDLWPDSVTQSGLVGGGLARRLDRALHAFCNWTYRRSTGIGVISPGMRAILEARGVPGSKIFDTPNWVTESHVATDEGHSRRDLGLPDGRLFMYAGNMGELQGLLPLVEAFARVPDARLVLLGDGVARPDLERVVARSRAQNVQFLGHRPSHEVGAFIRASDVQIVSLLDTPLLRATMPSKTQSSLAFGKPILAHAAGDVAALIRDHNIGAVAPPDDLEGSVSAIQSLVSATAAELSAMGTAARATFDERFSAEVGLDRLEAMLGTARGRDD